MADEQEGTLTPQGPTFELVELSDEEKHVQWLKDRQEGVGASEVSALFNLSPYGTTVQEVYDLKANKPEVGFVNPENPDMERGRYLEPIILKLYAKATGRQVLPARMLPNRGLFVHKDEPHMMATPDALQREPGAALTDQQTTTEVKSVRQKKLTYIVNRGLSDGWILQVQAQLEVCDRDWGTFVFHAADPWQMIHFDIERDRELGAALREKVREFWAFVERGERPVAPLSYDDLPRIVTPKGRLTIRTDTEWQKIASLYLEAKELLDVSEANMEAAKAMMKEAMGGFGRAEGFGIRTHYNQRDGRMTFDKDALAGAMPLDPILVSKAIFEVLHADDYKDLRTLLVNEINASGKMDLTRFSKRGNGYEELRVYPLKDGADEDAEFLPKPRLRLEKGKSDG